MADLTFKANLLPNSDLGKALGSSNQRWNIYGELNGNASSADKLKTARTLTIGGTSKDFDGSANVSWSKAEILGSSDTTKFYRGDQTWSNTLSGQMVATSFKINNTLNEFNNGFIELSGATPFIDFHFNNSVADHTSRIIENASGELKVIGKLKVATSTNWYALNAASFICDDWIRTKGASGWLNETYGGGWYMSDNTWIRSSHSKRVVCDNHLLISTKNPGNGYDEIGSALQIREVNGVGTGQSAWTYAPKIGFHWSNRAALQLGMDSSQYLRLYNISSDSSYGKMRLGGLFCQSENGVRFCNGTANKNFLLRNDGSNFWGLICTGSSEANDWITPGGGHPFRVQLDNGYTHFLRAYGAVWNDYAEFRITKNPIEPGRCVREIGDDTLELTTNRLQAGCEIVTDTYGFAIGESETAKTPTAASGRVLAYPYEDREEFRKHIGEPVCSGPNGTVSIMTHEEEKEWPSRIIGTISAVPDYEEWGTGKIKVNGRVWIRIR